MNSSQEAKATVQHGIASGAAIYPWREIAIGETFEADYCPRCFRALIAQAEKATRRKFEIVSYRRGVIVRRLA